MADVDLVLAAMRTNPKWYADHVETPLGHKQPPVAPPPPPDGEHMVLSLADPDAAQDTHLHELATAALSQIELRINRGEDHEVVVPDVVGAVFGSGSGHHELDRPPHVTAPYEELVRALLADPATVRRITRVACSIVAHE